MNAGWLLLVIGVGCSSSPTSSASSGVDASKSLSSLLPGEKQALCDWTARQFGGYDSRGVCADSATGGLQGPADQSGCLDQFTSYARCPATVAEFQACVQSEVHNACNWPAVSPTPECVFGTTRACGGSSDAGAE